MSMPSSIIIHKDVSLPVDIPSGLYWKEMEYGECSSEWVPDSYSNLDTLDGVEWDCGDSLIITSEGTYTQYMLLRK